MVPGLHWRRRSSSSPPLMPGIRSSATTMSTARLPTSSKAWRPLFATSTSKGWPRSWQAMAERESDTPGVSMILIDGKIVAKVSRNTPPAVRKAQVVD